MNSPDLLRAVLVALAGFLAFGISLWTGYIVWRRRRTAVPAAYTPSAPDLTTRPHGGISLTQSALPFVAGLLAGLAAVALGGGWIITGDRFYASGEGLLILGSMALALLLLLLRTGITSRVNPAMRLLSGLLIELLAAGLIVLAGIKFTVVGFGSAQQIELGTWAIPLTMLWLIAATWAVRLLDGIDGAAPVLLLTSGVAVLVGTWGTSEYLLAAIAVIMIGSVLGSLRFHFFPARFPLRGSATAIFGFVFAVLTVLARQKTVALLLLIFPLIVVVLLLGSGMLSILERTLFLSQTESDELETSDREERNDLSDQS